MLKGDIATTIDLISQFYNGGVTNDPLGYWKNRISIFFIGIYLGSNTGPLLDGPCGVHLYALQDLRYLK